MHDTLSLSLPGLASANSGTYSAVQRDRAELLASPSPDLLSMAREPLEPQRPSLPPLLLLRNWQPQSQPPPGGETLLQGVTRTSLRLRLQPRASGTRASARSLLEQPLGFLRSFPSGRKRRRIAARAARPERPRDNGEEAAAPGRAGSRESRLSLVGGRRGSLGSRSASAGQTSDPALLGRGLRIGPAGGQDAGGGGRGGVYGRRRR